MGAFLVRLGAARIQFLIIPFLFMPYRYFKVFLPAFVVLPLWLLQQLWYAHVAPEAGVAWWAHIGGFAFGAAVAMGLRAGRVEERWIDAGIEKQISIVQHPGLEKSVDLRMGGDFAGAKREIRRALAAEPQNVDAWTEVYEIAVAEHDTAEAGRTAQRLLEMHLRKGEKDLAKRKGTGAPPSTCTSTWRAALPRIRRHFVRGSARRRSCARAATSRARGLPMNAHAGTPPAPIPGRRRSTARWPNWGS